MSELFGEFVVHREPELVELRSRTGGPAGVVSVELGDTGIRVELDGADIDQLVALSVELDGPPSDAQTGVLERLLGPAIAEDLLGPAPARRFGTRSRRLNSAGRADVTPAVSGLTTAADALTRALTPDQVTPLLVLEVTVHAAALSLPLALDNELLSARRLGLALAQIDGEAYDQARRLVLEAHRLGLIDVAPADVLLDRPPLQSTAGPRTAPTVRGREMFLSVSNALRGEALGSKAIHAHTTDRSPQVRVDPGTFLADAASVVWVSPSNLELRVDRRSGIPEGLWARARRADDGVVIAAAPLIESLDGASALLLVGEHADLMVDLTFDVSSTPLSHQAGCWARALEEGRRAARLERLGRAEEADAAWQRCARWHGQAGDVTREKLALARSTMRPYPAAPTFSDLVL